MSDLVAQTVVSFILVTFIVAFILWLAKYRREILEWVAKPPSQDSEMEDFDTLREMGIEEKDAIDRIRHYRIHRKEIKAAISKDE